MSTPARLGQRHGGVPLVGGLALVATLAWLDELTGPHFRLAPVYLVPVSLAAWYSGRRSGAIVACAAAVAWFVAQLSSVPQFANPLVATWNGAVHLGSFLLLSEFICRLQAARDHLKDSVTRRTVDLAEQRRLAARVAEAMPAILFIWDLTTERVSYINGHVTAVIGLTPDEVLDTERAGLAALVHPEDAARAAGEFAQAVAGLADGGAHDVEVRVRDRGGLWHWLSIRSVLFSPTVDGQPTQVLGVARDVTEHMHLEEHERRRREEVAHAERLSLAGELAVNLAHELGQPLTAISSYADSCAMRLEGGICKPGDCSYALSQISAQAKRAYGIIRSLRDFMRRGERRRERVDLNAVINAATNLCVPEAREHNITIALDLQPELPPVEGELVQMDQVILNLMRNGIEALDGSDATAGLPPRLTLRTSSADGRSVAVTVHDNGKGLPVQDSEQVFAAFYTSKPDGMGMGLAISRTIIEEYGGRLWATPNPDRGTTFHVHLPAAGVAS
jgi:two-component system sensor kinase FixL